MSCSHGKRSRLSARVRELLDFSHYFPGESRLSRPTLLWFQFSILRASSGCSAKSAPRQLEYLWLQSALSVASRSNSESLCEQALQLFKDLNIAERISA